MYHKAILHQKNRNENIVDDLEIEEYDYFIRSRKNDFGIGSFEGFSLKIFI